MNHMVMLCYMCGEMDHLNPYKHTLLVQIDTDNLLDVIFIKVHACYIFKISGMLCCTGRDADYSPPINQRVVITRDKVPACDIIDNW